MKIVGGKMGWGVHTRTFANDFIGFLSGYFEMASGVLFVALTFAFDDKVAEPLVGPVL